MRFFRHRAPDFWVPQRVPTGPVEIDRGHPLARNLRRMLYFGGGAQEDLVAQSGPVTIGAGAAPMVSPIGTGISFASAPDAVSAASDANSQVYTFETLVFTGTALASMFILGFDSTATGASGSAFDRALQTSATGAIEFYWYPGAAQYVTGPLLSANTLYHIAATCTGTTVTLHVNGASVGSAATTSGGANYVPYLLAGYKTGSYAFSGAMLYGGMRDVALQAGEISALAAAPFAMLRPRFVPRRRGMPGASPLVFVVT